MSGKRAYHFTAIDMDLLMITVSLTACMQINSNKPLFSVCKAIDMSLDLIRPAVSAELAFPLFISATQFLTPTSDLIRLKFYETLSFHAENWFKKADMTVSCISIINYP